jgi:hypothetical protein
MLATQNTQSTSTDTSTGKLEELREIIKQEQVFKDVISDKYLIEHPEEVDWFKEGRVFDIDSPTDILIVQNGILTKKSKVQYAEEHYIICTVKYKHHRMIKSCNYKKFEDNPEYKQIAYILPKSVYNGMLNINKYGGSHLKEGMTKEEAAKTIIEFKGKFPPTHQKMIDQTREAYKKELLNLSSLDEADAYELDNFVSLIKNPKYDKYKNNKTKYPDTITVEIMVKSSLPKKRKLELCNKYSQNITKAVVKIIKDDPKFSKLDIPISYYKATRTLTNDSALFYLLSLKMEGKVTK